MFSVYQRCFRVVLPSQFWNVNGRNMNYYNRTKGTQVCYFPERDMNVKSDGKAANTVARKTEHNIKMATQEKSKPNKVQDTLKYRQTKLNLNQYSSKRFAETKVESPHTNPQRSFEKGTRGKTVCIESKNEIVTEVPAIVPMPEIRRVFAEGLTKVVIDLETSSRADDAEICQIAATDGSDEFNVYIIPKHYITSGASAVNKLRKKKGGLYQGRERLSAVYQNEGLRRLLTWLKWKTPCLLIAHNAKSFDAKHLLNALASCKEMGEFSQKVLGFSDSLTAFRERFPKRISYSQTSLANDLLRETYNAHNALEDVRILQRLVSKFISEELLLKHSFTVSWYRQHLAHTRMTQENMKSLTPLLKSGNISEGMARKIAGSGLRMSHLEFAYQNGGEERLCCVLNELHEGKPRVTNQKKILAEICSFFEEKTKDYSLDTQKTE